jgi:hypothetical protein
MRIVTEPSPAPRPWPAPSPNVSWWRGESAGPHNGAALPHAGAPTTQVQDPAPAQAAEPVQTIEPAQATSPVQAAEPVQPAEQAAEPVQPAEQLFPLWPTGQDVPIPDVPIPAAVDDPIPAPALTVWAAPQLRVEPTPRQTSPRPTSPHPTSPRPAGRLTRRRPPRRPLVGLAGLLGLALLTTVLAWVTADPLWLAMGHGQHGTVTVVGCVGEGLAQRCTGSFATADGTLRAQRVALVGLPVAAKKPGATLAARMVSAKGHVAYAGDRDGLHPRWAFGLAVILLCGLGVGWVSGASRLSRRRARLGAYATSLAAPLVPLAAMLIAIW